MHKTAGHLIAITKHIWLKQPDGVRTRQTKFIPRNFIHLPCPPCVHLWRTDITDRKISEFASMLCESGKDMDAKDVSGVIKTVENVLHEACGDIQIFDLNSIVASRFKTLFECRAIIDISHFANKLLNKILEEVGLSITTWAGICVAPRIECPSFGIPSYGLYVIAKNDIDVWQNEILAKYRATKWSPILCPGINDIDPAFCILNYTNAFVSISQGTESRSRVLSQFRLRQLFAVLTATAIESSSYVPHKSCGEPCRIWVQHPANNSTLDSQMISSSDTLFPYLLNECKLSQNNTNRVIDWYSALSALDQRISNRIEKCAYFVNRAMNASGIESYLNYFISLDALFGVRGSVVESIANGVKHLAIPSKLLEKICLLTDLRHELVHGGSRSIFEWPKFTHYRSHFMSNPESDIQELAFMALMQSTTLPRSAYAQ